VNHIAPNPSIDSLMPIVQRPDVVFERGEGAYLFDSHGRRYLDWVQGWAVNCLGHAPKVVAEALARQAATLINPSPAFYNRPAMELAALLDHAQLFRPRLLRQFRSRGQRRRDKTGAQVGAAAQGRGA
jgi:acetylornithine/N-succinyldiaminopimelate aminotransferase